MQYGFMFGVVLTDLQSNRLAPCTTIHCSSNGLYNGWEVLLAVVDKIEANCSLNLSQYDK